VLRSHHACGWSARRRAPRIERVVASACHQPGPQIFRCLGGPARKRLHSPATTAKPRPASTRAGRLS
jgi:hypothetical protein